MGATISYNDIHPDFGEQRDPLRNVATTGPESVKPSFSYFVGPA